jgi:hypothetical protein
MNSVSTVAMIWSADTECTFNYMNCIKSINNVKQWPSGCYKTAHIDVNSDSLESHCVGL